MTEENISNKLADDLEKLLDELEPEKIAEMDYDELIKYRSKLNPYGRTIEGSDNFLTFSYTNISENYLKKLITTSMVGFLNRMVDEWHVPDGIPVIPVYDYVKDPSKIDSFAKDWTITDKIGEDIEENRKWMAKRVVVKEFLEEMFQYNPDEHVRSSYRPQTKDTDRQVIDTPAANLAINELTKKDVEFREQMLEYDRLHKLLNMAKSTKEEVNYSVEQLENLVKPKILLPEVDYQVMDFSTWSPEDKNILRHTYEMIPPVDSFHRFTYYMESNYDKLRESVLHLYCDKPDFDIAINPYQWHKTEDEAVEFQKKHRSEVITDIFKAHSGKWNFVAPFKKVRESMKYFNENTIVLEEISRQIEADSKLGGELMKNRIKIKKKKNIKEDGPDAEAFKKWRENNDVLKSMGAESVNQDSYADDDIADENAVQVDVFRISKGGLEMKKDKFYTKAEPYIVENE